MKLHKFPFGFRGFNGDPRSIPVFASTTVAVYSSWSPSAGTENFTSDAVIVLLERSAKVVKDLSVEPYRLDLFHAPGTIFYRLPDLSFTFFKQTVVVLEEIVVGDSPDQGPWPRHLWDLHLQVGRIIRNGMARPPAPVRGPGKFVGGWEASEIVVEVTKRER